MRKATMVLEEPKNVFTGRLLADKIANTEEENGFIVTQFYNYPTLSAFFDTRVRRTHLIGTIFRNIVETVEWASKALKKTILKQNDGKSEKVSGKRRLFVPTRAYGDKPAVDLWGYDCDCGYDYDFSCIHTVKMFNGGGVERMEWLQGISFPIELRSRKHKPLSRKIELPNTRIEEALLDEIIPRAYGGDPSCHHPSRVNESPELGDGCCYTHQILGPDICVGVGAVPSPLCSSLWSLGKRAAWPERFVTGFGRRFNITHERQRAWIPIRCLTLVSKVSQRLVQNLYSMSAIY
ncbi:hypothetical protein BDQ17DRAFT_1334601 [Cyathus striatus]|nr:hypothetical protein BDQ17DRAFT_1334601 [Cyathus striatus]